MKIKRLFFVFALAMFSILFFSCDGDIKIQTFISDLEYAAGNGETVYVKAHMFVGGLSLDNKETVDYLRQNLNGFENVKAETVNYSNGLSFDIKIPVVNINKKNSFSSRNDIIVIWADGQADSIDFYYEYYKPVFQKIDSFIFSKNYTHIEIEKFTTDIEINNDIRDERTICANCVYVNKTAYPSTFEKTVSRRDYVTISLSEIVRQSISQGDQWCIFSIRK